MVVAVAAGALLVGGVTVLPQVASAADDTALNEGQRALAEAKASGQQVELPAQRSEYDTVYAQPDGFTFTLEESAAPVRVRATGGSWVKPDTTLAVRPDGSVGPKAAAVEVAFSNGGSTAPLVMMGRAGKSFSLGWSESVLPKPTLEGDTAVFHDVLPDVDLRMTATVEGYRQLLVVNTPAAAANPALKQVEFSLKSTGLNLAETQAGGMVARDGDGKEVFSAPPATMWNSRSIALATAQKRAVGFQTVKSADADAVAADMGNDGPAPGDDSAPLGVDVGKDSVTLTPDADLLTKTDASAFPLYIDPNTTWGESTRTLLRDDGYEDYAWGNGDDDRGKGDGMCGSWNGYYCGPGYKQRLFFQFSPAALKGKQVLSAAFWVTEPWAFQCDPRAVDLIRTGNISSSTTWSNQPSTKTWDTMVDRSVSAGRGSACENSEPEAAIDFHDNPAESNENLTPTVKSFAAGNFSTLTLMLKAHDESDTSAWKRFKNDAVLKVNFVGIPAIPTAVGVSSSSGNVCRTSESSAQVIGDRTPHLVATAQAASGGESGAQLRVGFDVDMKNSSGAWVDAPEPSSIVRPTSGFIGDGTATSIDWATLADNATYRYRAWTYSYYDNDTTYLSGPTSANSPGWCYFRVDSTAPKEPKIVGGAPYTECLTNNCVAAGGPGQAASFELQPADGDTTNISYRYRTTQGGSAVTARHTSGKWYADVTPARSGTITLYAEAEDTLNGWGETRVYSFLVKDTTKDSLVGQWNFDENSGAAKDTSGATGTHDALLSASGAARDGRGRRGLVYHDGAGNLLVDASGVPAPMVDLGLSLDGANSGYAATSGPVVETRSSYTLSAWVRITGDGSRNETFLSEDGAHRSPFYLGYEASSKKWSFRVVDSDAPANGTWNYTTVSSANPATFGVWTHVAATYDASSKQIHFFVNGVWQGKTSFTTAWSATGPMQFGRAKWSDAYTDYVNGSVDEVKVWQMALPSDTVADEARALDSGGWGATEMVSDWDMNDQTGATFIDTKDSYGHNLTLEGGATLNGQDLVLNGTDAAATTPSTPVDDAGSFTATTLVNVDRAAVLAKPDGYTAQILGNRTSSGSSWGLWLTKTGTETVVDDDFNETTVPVGLWYFGRLNSDGTITGVQSDDAAAIGATVRLTGVFNAQDQTASLYVGLAQNGITTPYTAQLSSDPLAVGKGWTNNAWGHWLPGVIGEIRIWAGAMTGPDEVQEIIGD
ncbi:LamG-like jellyroll fold domain-containing protein [Streptomyces sp. NPDC008139]|uniref:LamG domain-containing protein n=1 Tax=Streptomyces sp. NPDC008139 TaxID=3364814 RepID=UPI0036DFAC6F